MSYREYNNGIIEIPDFMQSDDYQKAHEKLVIVCHDIFINYKGRILLVKRNIDPGIGNIWMIGGRILKGMNTEDSLKAKVKDECGLYLDCIEYRGLTRTYFKKDPFGHGKGTDTINLVYTGNGTGEIKLNKDHYSPILIDRKEYQNIKKTLSQYLIDYLDLIFS